MVGGANEILGQGVKQGAKLAENASEGAAAGSQEAAQLLGVSNQASALSKVMKGTALVGSYVSAAESVLKAANEGGVKNWTIAGLKTAWAITQTMVEVNPAVAIGMAAIDIVGTAAGWW